jgi:hypothetical protein
MNDGIGGMTIDNHLREWLLFVRQVYGNTSIRNESHLGHLVHTPDIILED